MRLIVLRALDELTALRRERDAYEKIAREKDETIAVLLSGTVEEVLQRRLAAARERIGALEAGLRFYADPATYAAIAFLPDRPCGEFVDDFSDPHDGDFPGMRPGKLARARLAEPEP